MTATPDDERRGQYFAGESLMARDSAGEVLPTHQFGQSGFRAVARCSHLS